MAEPTEYERGYSFADYQADRPNRPLPGDELDNELDNISNSVTATQTALRDIRRSDGKLKNGIVGADALNKTAVGALIGQSEALMEDVVFVTQMYLGQLADDPDTGREGAPLTEANWYFNTTSNSYRFWNGASWEPLTGTGSMQTYFYVLGAGQTVIEGDDENNSAHNALPGSAVVALNGILLTYGQDYTIPTAGRIVLSTAALAGDEATVITLTSIAVTDIGRLRVSSFTGDGVTRTFALPGSVVSRSNVRATIDGIAQHRRSFTAAGSTITFSEAPPNDSDIELEVYTLTPVASISGSDVELATGESVQDFVNRTGVVTPEAFGDVNGVNDQAQINAAIAYVDAQGGGEVWLPGQYVVSPSGTWNTTNGDLNACIRVETTNPVYLRGIKGVTKITQVGTRIAHTVAFGKRVGTNVPSRGGITNCWIVGNRETAVSEGIPYEGGIGISIAGPGYEVVVSDNIVDDAYAYGIGWQRAWWQNCRCERNVIRRTGNDGMDCKFDYPGDLDPDPSGTLEGGNPNNWIIDNYISEPALNWATLVGQKAGIDVREGWNTRGNKIYASTPVAGFRTQHDDEGISTPELDAGAPDTDNTRIRWQGSHEGIEVFFASDAVHTGTDGSGAALESRGVQIGTYASQFDNVRVTRGNYGVWCRASRAVISGLKTRDCATGLAIYGNSIESASNVKVFGGDLRGGTYDVRVFGTTGYLPADTGLHGVTAGVVNIAADVARTALMDCRITSLTDAGTDTVSYGTTPFRLRAGRSASQFIELSGDNSANYITANSATGLKKPLIITSDNDSEGIRLDAPVGTYNAIRVAGNDIARFETDRLAIEQPLSAVGGNFRSDWTFASRAAFTGAAVPTWMTSWKIMQGGRAVYFRRDDAATNPAITSANGVKGIPDGDATPLHWGAIGDGTTDDTTAVRGCLAFGGSIAIDLIYKITNVVFLASGSRVFGRGKLLCGPASGFTDTTSSDHRAAVLGNIVSDVEWRDVNIDTSAWTALPPGAASARALHFYRSNNIRVRDAYFTVASGAVSATACYDVLVAENQIYVSQMGALADIGADGIIDLWTGWDTDLLRVTVRDNHIVGSGFARWGIMMTGDTASAQYMSVENVKITGNTITGTIYDSIWAFGRDAELNGITITGNVCRSGRKGISLSDAKNFVIGSNVIATMTSSGIHLWSETANGGTLGCVDGAVVGNSLTDVASAAGTPVALWVDSNSADVLINGNKISGTTHYYGISTGASTTGITVSQGNVVEAGRGADYLISGTIRGFATQGGSGAVMTGAAIWGGVPMQGQSAVIADDAVASFTPPGGRQFGFALVQSTLNINGMSRMAIVAYRCQSGSLEIEKAPGWTTVGAGIDVTTSNLTGTTGTDGRITVGVQAGVLKVENRNGFSATFYVHFL